MINKKLRLVTCGIKNCRHSTLLKGCSPHQVLNGLIGHRPQTATFHTTTVSGKCSRSVDTEL